MDGKTKIEAFLEGKVFAVAGASTNREKFGNKVLRNYLRHGLTAHPVNPRAEEIEGQRAYPDIASLPDDVHGLSIVTPPKITDQVVEEAIEKGIRYLWMQPGAESDAAVRRAEDEGLTIIHGGPCVLVELP